mmetsp:Transcript_111187/g.270185  ORF Transcript_111187/g.270185 Transcript_111187/m.270185 type:complete len:264 (-) Transcript_111187:1126-1917(-)
MGHVYHQRHHLRRLCHHCREPAAQHPVLRHLLRLCHHRRLPPGDHVVPRLRRPLPQLLGEPALPAVLPPVPGALPLQLEDGDLHRSDLRYGAGADAAEADAREGNLGSLRRLHQALRHSDPRLLPAAAHPRRHLGLGNPAAVFQRGVPAGRPPVPAPLDNLRDGVPHLRGDAEHGRAPGLGSLGHGHVRCQPPPQRRQATGRARLGRHLPVRRGLPTTHLERLRGGEEDGGGGAVQLPEPQPRGWGCKPGGRRVPRVCLEAVP